MLTARHYRIHGRVQGVGFRFFAEHTARRENLSGYVRNADDGTVEVQVEGEAAAVTRFEWAIRQGPRGARVDQVDVTELTPSARQTGFIVAG